MKKLFTFFLCIILAANSAAFAAEDTINTKELSQVPGYNLLEGLGILPHNLEDITTDSSVTRGEFAYMLYKMLHINEPKGVSDIWENTFWGEKKDNIIENENTVSVFSDLSESTEYLDEINYVSQKGLVQGRNGSGKGLIEGFNKNTFAPDNPVTIGEAARAIVLLLGYDPIIEEIIDTPEHYYKIAASIGIVDGAVDSNIACSYSDAIKLIVLSMDTKILKVNFESGSKRGYILGDTMLREIMRIDKVKGTLTDNGITAIDGPSQIGHEQVKIGNLVLDNKTKKNMYSLIGYNVEAYRSIDGDTENEVYYISATKKNIVTEIKADDFEKYENGRLYYSKNGLVKQYVMEKPFFVIKNGEMLSDWTASDFEFENGRTIVIDAGEWYKTIIIEDYESRLISIIDKKNYTIYSKNHCEDAKLEMYALDLTDYIDEDSIEIKKADGTTASFDDITENMTIDVMKSNKYISIVLILGVKENFTLSSFEYDEDGSAKIVGEQEEYTVPKSYFDKGGTNFNIEETYNLFINSFGKVIWTELVYKDTYKTGWLIESRYIDDDAEYIVFKVFKENGEFEKIRSAEKIRLKVSYDDSVTLKARKLYNRIEEKRGLIRYKADKENKLTEIEFASDIAKEGEYLQAIFDASSGITYRDEGLKFCSFDFKFYISDDTKIFVVPKSEQYKGNSDYYSIGKKASMFTANALYSLKAYSLKKGSKYAEYLVYESDNRVQQKFGYTKSDMNFLTVESITEGLNDDDEACTVITGWKHGANINFEYTTLYSKAELSENGINATDAATDTLRTGNIYKVKKGDIIRYLTDASGKYITKAEILYRSFAENPVNPSGTMGALAGSVGYFDESPVVVNGIRYEFNPFSNPYAITETGYESAEDSVNGSMYVFDGFAYKDDSSIITLTTADLAVNAYSDTNPKYKQICRYLNTGVYAMTSITRTEKDITAKKGSYSDIKTFEKYGSDCSRMVIICKGGFPVQIFIINAE